MLINFFKIFFSIFLIIYQIPVYSKNNYINKFNYKDLSNYFSAQVSYDNQESVDALNFLRVCPTLGKKWCFCGQIQLWQRPDMFRGVLSREPDTEKRWFEEEEWEAREAEGMGWSVFGRQGFIIVSHAWLRPAAKRFIRLVNQSQGSSRKQRQWTSESEGSEARQPPAFVKKVSSVPYIVCTMKCMYRYRIS